MSETELLTVGVEEEFLLVDPETGHPVPAVDWVIEELSPQLRPQVQHEFLASQIEIGSAPVMGLDALRRSLAALREALADAAERVGVRLIAVGAAPIGGGLSAPVVDNPRFLRMAEQFRGINTDSGLNGMHVHIGMPDRELGVQVLNHLRPWLPLLAAATANSPFFDGRDTGYASWRSVAWNMWPSVGPSPYMESVAEYEELIEQLIDTGAMFDDGMLYWYGRLSAHLPTVELRLGDVCPTADDAILLAALVRGLVATVLEDIHAGRPAPRTPHQVLTAAHWLAARDGLEGQAIDPATGRRVPAWELLNRLILMITPALERHGDLHAIAKPLKWLRGGGTGAARQRVAADSHLGFRPEAVIPYLSRLTRDNPEHA